MIPLGTGTVDQEGSDVTIVTYGATVELARQAVALLEGTPSVEIVDLRCLIPWDQELVARSVAKTGRVLVLHEDIRTSGFGAEVASWIAESCFDDLDAPVARIGAKDCHVAYEPSLEDAILPQPPQIAATLETLLAY